ncbi:MAG: serine/threonine protein kinase [Myxococcales bacterium]|nr:serine/threonine protein kinase [Myxococcales bacterium]MCB9520126.1 serine/threonine protein kinase [Myxococcales bacterium]MCB9531253.1 serine/threonine protein kinase [Myxococcales bacterium]
MDDSKIREQDASERDGDTSEHDVASATQAMSGGSPGDLVGQLIDGKYRVEALIGAGGMGKVYRGRNIRTDSPVAIKTLIPDLVSDETLVKRFEVEAKSASNLRHPNTIRIFDFGREGTVLFMVMELLDGSSLEGLLQREGRLAPGRVIEVVRQTCRSLDEAHSAGLVHRDIKPDNIFLNRVSRGADEDHVKVLDFGVAKLKDKQYGSATLTQAGMIFGTPRYMSPEQARAFELDGRSDIYALGVVMFECLTGAPPFTANDAVGILIKHVNEPIPTFADIDPNLEPMPELEEIVRRCMAKKPDDRFDDVRNLLNALDGVAPIYGLGGTTGTTSIARSGPEQTRAFDDAPNQTPSAGVRSDAFDALGVKSGASRYTLGAAADIPSGPHATAGPKSPVVKIAAAIGGLVVLVGVALMALVHEPAADPVAATPAAEPGAEPAAATPPTPPAADLALVEPVIEVARLRIDSAFTSAATAVAATVVPIDLRVRPDTAEAVARIEGSDDEPVALPHIFYFTRDPSSPPVSLKFEVTAPGFRATTQDVPLRRSEAPVFVELRAAPASGGGGGTSSGGGGRSSGGNGRVSIPSAPRNTGPLTDPYGGR